MGDIRQFCSTTMLLRWGIVGAGKISHDFAVSLSTLSVKKHQIFAVASRTLQSAQDFANKHNIKKYYSSYLELFKNPDVDVVYVAVINPMHREVVKLALDHGKHVLCEKPMCLTAKDTQELINYAQRKNLFLMEGLFSRFLPSYEKLKEELDSGSIGTVMQVIASFGGPCEHVERIRLASLGGGSVLDRGCYCIQLASLVFEGEKPAQTLSGGHLNPDGVDMSSSTTLIYSSGRTATLLTHCTVNLPNDAYIVGTKGTIKISAPFWKTRKIETPTKEYTFSMPVAEKPTIFWDSTGLAYQIEEVRRCIMAGLGESPGVSHDESILIAEISDSIRAQINEHNCSTVKF